MNFNIIRDYKEIYEICKRFNREELLLTFQNNNIEDSDYIVKNWNGYKSYEWLKERIGYYPIWTIRITKSDLLSYNHFSNLMCATLSEKSKYLYIIDSEKCEDKINTKFFNWVEIHDIENRVEQLTDKYDIDIKNQYSANWKSFLLIDDKYDDIVQTIIPSISSDCILEKIDLQRYDDKCMNIMKYDLIIKALNKYNVSIKDDDNIILGALNKFKLSLQEEHSELCKEILSANHNNPVSINKLNRVRELKDYISIYENIGSDFRIIINGGNQNEKSNSYR